MNSQSIDRRFMAGKGNPDELLDIYEHLEELKEYSPKSEEGKKKLRFYKQRMTNWRVKSKK